MFEMTRELTQRAGLPAYEISNHARPGQESRHNLIYWRSGDWAGVGPGAHGRLSLPEGRLATEAYRMPAEWLSAVENRRNGEAIREIVSDGAIMEERLIMGLRLSEGVPVGLLDDRVVNKINMLCQAGLLEIDDKRMRATQTGRPLLNFVLREMLA